MSTQGKKHMGGRRRYINLDNPTSMRNIPASRDNIKAKTPVAPKKPTGKGAWTTMGDQPTRKMLGVKIVKGGK